MERPRRDLLEEIIDGPLRMIENLDSMIRRVDEILREFDNRLSYRSLEFIEINRGRGRRIEAISPSYPGQTRTDYCLECLERHYAKAHGLLEEAERFSLKYGKITPEAREKIRRAIEEIVTAEDDLGTVIEDEEVGKIIDNIKVLQRDIRKWMWARGLTTTSESIEDLRRAKEMVKRLLDKTYEAAEKYRSKYGVCPACLVDPMVFFNMLCEKIGDKCFDALNKFIKGEISDKEFIKIVTEEGKAKGITDEEIMKLMERARKS
ncbi:MAG: hypothetical protein QXQ91_04445 [Nanopusillaceae archaeon]